MDSFSSSRVDISNKVVCYAHPDAYVIEDYHAGDMICSECGLVVGDRIIHVGAEWRLFNNEVCTTNPSRVGGPQNPLLEGSDLSTVISARSAATAFEPSVSLNYRNQRAKINPDNAFISAFKTIALMADRINLPKTIGHRANELFKKIHNGKYLSGRTSDAKASACLYIACRQEGVPRTFKEICSVSSTSKKEIGRCFKLAVKALEKNMESTSAGDFICRFCANLDLPLSVQRATKHIAKKAAEMDLVHGRAPISVAAAAIYMVSQASEHKRTHKEIGEIVGVADETLKQSYRLLYPHAAEIFPEDFEFTTNIDQLPQL